MRMPTLSIICFFLVACSACNKSTSPDYNDRPVVISYLFAGRHPTVQISRQASTSSGVGVSSENLKTLKVYLSDDSTVHLLRFSDTVYTDTNVVVAAGRNYKLSFLYNGKEVTASTTIPSHPVNVSSSATAIWLDKIDESTFASGPPSFSMPDPVDIEWTNDDKSYYMLVAENTTADPELVRDTISNSSRPAFSFRNQPSVTASVRLPSMSFEYFGLYRLVLYHLQPEYATLYEQESNSSQSLTTPVTNIVNGFGIFTGINADTLYLQVIKN